MAANWIHPGDGDWNLASNWTGDVVPGLGDTVGEDVTLDHTANGISQAYNVDILSTESFGVGNLTITGENAEGGTITLGNSGTLTTAALTLSDATFLDGVGISPGTLSAETIAFNGRAVLNIAVPGSTATVTSTAANAVFSTGSDNSVDQTGSTFIDDGGATFSNSGLSWVLTGGSQASFSGLVQGTATFDFLDDTADRLTLGTGQGATLRPAITGFSFNSSGSDEIDLKGLAFGTGVFTNNTGTSGPLMISRDGSVVFTFNSFSAGRPPEHADFSEIRYSNDGSGGTLITLVCFAAGTRIAAEAGEVAVEDLRAGDLVVTLEAGSRVLRPVRWVGRRRLRLRDHRNGALAAPVRIRAGAFADGVPYRDLMVSPDHALLTEGGLMQARQLINHGTICQETNAESVDYFHVELDRHTILLAEGLPVESYLDTGNRGFFANSGEPLVLHPDLTDESDYPTREAGSCVPFVWDEANVRPVWQRLADRAAAIGQPVPQPATTTEAALRVRGKKGERNHGKPLYADSNLLLFVLPRGDKEFRLISRAQSPTEARPWLEDRRKLGVRVKRIVLRGANELHEIPLDHPSLTKGWWAVERDGQMMSRWTDGDAVLPLPSRVSGDVILEIHLADAMTYLVDAAPESQTGTFSRPDRRQTARRAGVIVLGYPLRLSGVAS